MVKLTPLTPTSSVAEPVIVNVSEFTGLPGPVMLVSGGTSEMPNVSNFLAALVLSAVPLDATARALTCSSRLPEMVIGRRQVRFGPEHRGAGPGDLAHDLLQLPDERRQIGRLAEPGAEEVEPGAHHRHVDPLVSIE